MIDNSRRWTANDGFIYAYDKYTRVYVVGTYLRSDTATKYYDRI